jgi:hypothetical protein
MWSGGVATNTRCLSKSDPNGHLSTQRSYTRHAKPRPDLRYASRQKVDGPQTREGDQQSRKLLKPGMEVSSRHEQHPPHHSRNAKRKLDTSRSRLALRLDQLFLHCDTSDLTIRKRNESSIPQSLNASESRQELQPKQRAPQDKQENVSRDIMTPLPRSTNSLARSSRNVLARIAHIIPRILTAKQLALTPCKPKPAINQRRPKEPLRKKAPPRRHQRIPQQRSNPPRTRPSPETRVERHEDGEGDRRPEPAYFDKVYVEDVLLLREIRGREFGGVRLQDGGVGCGAVRGRERCEYTAEEQGEGVDCYELRFEACGEEGRPPRGGGR